MLHWWVTSALWTLRVAVAEFMDIIRHVAEKPTADNEYITVTSLWHQCDPRNEWPASVCKVNKDLFSHNCKQSWHFIQTSFIPSPVCEFSPRRRRLSHAVLGVLTKACSYMCCFSGLHADDRPILLINSCREQIHWSKMLTAVRYLVRF